MVESGRQTLLKSEKRIMTTRDKVFYFWGVMDVIGIAWYIMGPIASLENMWASAAGNLAVVIFFFASAGPLAGLFYLAYLITPFTFFISAWLFFKRSGAAIKFALVQEVLRFLTFRCSVALFPLLAGKLGVAGGWMNISLLILSEALKIGSLIYVAKKHPIKRDESESK
ncbi:hypothetical protein [Pseudescherichia sp.]|uniref:hypothetical protein n=4 Tax=Enterobacteriaceae TaxID=543 RepID=UPI0028A02871|nr:hypothetical protein [Pseudescherichia sp.]